MKEGYLGRKITSSLMAAAVAVTAMPRTWTYSCTGRRKRKP